MSTISDRQFQVGAILVALIIVVVLSRVRFCSHTALPEMPPKPQPSATEQSSRELKKSTANYEAFLVKDAAEFATQELTLKDAARKHQRQLDKKREVLEPGDVVKKAGLRLKLEVEKVSKHKHLVLHIENLTDVHLAYRVDTRPTRGRVECRRKVALGHNAIAITPRGLIRRTECRYEKGYAIEVREVETIEIPELGYYYVSALEPKFFGLDERATDNHHPPSERMRCLTTMTMGLKRQVETGQITWRDMIDFYSRHRCSSYIIPNDYKAFEQDGARALPAVTKSP